jgi:hypothetical protein
MGLAESYAVFLIREMRFYSVDRFAQIDTLDIPSHADHTFRGEDTLGTHA